jgi:hypothetical protein
VSTFVRHADPFTPYDERPAPDAALVAAMPPHDDILPPVVGDDFRHRVGVKPLDPANWFVRDAEWQPTIDMKRRLLATRRNDVVARTADTDDVVETAIDEAARLVLDWADASTTKRGIDALVDAALCIPDDLTVLAPVRVDRVQRLPFVAGVVCSPSRWRLRDKIGLDMLAVHQPVARYAEHIGAAVDVTLERLAEQRPVWRSNWTLEDHPALFQPAVPDQPLVDAPGDLWIRIERETLRRLPHSGGVLFTIRGFQQPLRDYVQRGRDVATNLHRLVSRLPDDVARYKSIYAYREAVLSWLDGVIDSYDGARTN